MRAGLFIKREHPFTQEAQEFLGSKVDSLKVYKGMRGDPFPEDAIDEEFDIVFSYLSQWIIPETVLHRTRLWNINFHTGPPKYPGIGCTNFAIYNEENEFGITAHIMEAKVDTGRIIGVKMFALNKEDTVFTLTQKCYEAIFEIFKETVNYILEHQKLPQTDEMWQRKPYTRKELEELCRIDLSMNEEEVNKRIKATTYPDMPGAYIEIYGHKFEFNAKR